MFGLVIVIVAIAGTLGFYIGRYRRRGGKLLPTNPEASAYHQSLRFLLNEQTDSSVDIFINSLEVNPDTLDIHLAVAGLMRRKGEITKAITIHEHLLHGNALLADDSDKVQLELAQNYVHAGLLDRAEMLLQSLIKSRSSFTAKALEQLLWVYQEEKEWEKAVEVANKLHQKTDQFGAQELAQMKSHYCCEMAEENIARQDLQKAKNYLQSAFQYQQNSVRASLIAARLAYDEKMYLEALGILKKIPEQDGELIGESLSLVVSCFTQLGDQEGLRKFLFSLLNHRKANSVIVSLSRVIAEQQGVDAAVSFLELQVRQKPSIRVLKHIIDLYLEPSEGKARQNLELLKLIVEKVIAEKPVYLCNRCGFTAVQLHWLCPGCKTWGNIKPVKGVSGE